VGSKSISRSGTNKPDHVTSFKCLARIYHPAGDDQKGFALVAPVYAFALRGFMGEVLTDCSH